jgi:endonuclease/exonuclease/phosphatase family metal-dependent hydrolase
MNVTITTFNLENLFNRYAILDEPWDGRSYEKVILAYDVASIASRDGDLVSYETTHLQRNNTALAIEQAAPDILVAQEVENLIALRNFNHIYLDDYFEHLILIDGNDPRGIDVGVLLKRGFGGTVSGVRTHIDDPNDPKKPIVREGRKNFGYLAQNALFSRDCLEIDVAVGKKTLTLLANHLKAQDDTASSVERRKTQAKRVSEIFSANVKAKRLPVVLGDLNFDYRATKKNGTSANDGSLDPLLATKDLVDPLPAGEWTHYYASEKSVSRLDYILPHKNLALSGPPVITRNGLTTKCKQYTGTRFPTIGPEHTEASDHCPLSVTFAL